MFSQPCGLDSQALSQPLGVGTRRAERSSWIQTPLAQPKKENVPQCHLSSGGKALLSDFSSSPGEPQDSNVIKDTSAVGTVMGSARMVLPGYPIPLAAVLATSLVHPWEPGDQAPLTLHSIAYTTTRYRIAPSKGGCQASSHRH